MTTCGNCQWNWRDNSKEDVILCPLHAAAEDMRTLLRNFIAWSDVQFVGEQTPIADEARKVLKEVDGE